MHTRAHKITPLLIQPRAHTAQAHRRRFPHRMRFSARGHVDSEGPPAHSHTVSKHVHTQACTSLLKGLHRKHAASQPPKFTHAQVHTHWHTSTVAYEQIFIKHLLCARQITVKKQSSRPPRACDLAGACACTDTHTVVKSGGHVLGLSAHRVPEAEWTPRALGVTERARCPMGTCTLVTMSLLLCSSHRTQPGS